MQKVLRYFLVGVFLSSLFLTASAADFVKLTQINTDDGLNQGSVNRLMQDSDGYIWIGTAQGVNTYDGYRVSTVYSKDNILITNEVELLFEDSHGIIWIGASPQNNYQLDKTTNLLRRISLPAPEGYKLEDSMFTRAVEDDKGNLWLTTYYELFYYNRQQDSFEFITSTNAILETTKKETIFRDLLIVNQHLLMATSEGLYALNTQSKKISKVLHTNTETQSEDQKKVKFLMLNQLNQILIGTVEGLFQISPTAISSENTQYSAKQVVKDLNIWSIIEKNDLYWIATDKGLYQLSKSGDLKFVLKFSDTAFNTRDDDIVAMIEDREGILWLASRTDGVFKWHPNIAIKQHYWQKAEAGKKLSENTVTAIQQTPDKAIWIGTQNGLNKVDPITQQVSQLMVNPNEKEVISDSTIVSITHNKGKVWVNTYGGILVFDQKTLQKENIIFPTASNPELFTKPALDLHFFDQDNLAIVNAEGIYNYNLQTNQVSLLEATVTNGQIAPRLITIFTTATGDRDSYFISGVDRLVKFSRETGQLVDFHQLPKSDNYRSSPNDIYRDGDKLWVTYPGYGIYILNANSGEEIKFFSEASLGANTVMDIFPDKSGNLWFSTNEGLLKLNKTTYSQKILDSNDGFATSEFNGLTKQILDNGEVFLGSMKGAFHLSPDDLASHRNRIITPHITKVSLLSGEIENRYGHYDNYHIKLKHFDFGLKLEFSALLFDKPEQVKYHYWIEGASAIERTTISQSELFFPFLASGESTLFISAVDYETGLESQPLRVKITSIPAPWLSTPAYLAYLLTVFLILAFLLHRYRKRQISQSITYHRIKQSEERLNLALKGGNSGLWDWHADSNSVFEPRLLRQKSDGEMEEKIPFERRLDAIHPEDQKQVISVWKNFLEEKTEVYDVVYRMRNTKGNWLWYRDMATVSEEDENKRPTRVTGTFTNITTRKADRDKMRLFSKAFENTRDIVFVLNSQKEVIAANRAFYKTTEYDPKIVMGSGISFITDFEGNRRIVAQLFRQIHLDQHWEGEGLLLRFIKSPLAVLINATSFLDNDNKLNFVFALTDISKQKMAEAELRKLANYDSLTGLPNRALLMDRISHAIEHCKRRKQRLAVFFIDLDRFKHVNDSLGHDIGDQLLIYVATTIRRSIRHDDSVARLGGDEFVVLLEDIDELDVINRIAVNIIEQMKESVMLRENQVSTSPSIGIAIYPNDGKNAQTLLKHADVAMYHAKNAGRNNFQYFENSMNHAAKNRLILENKLRLAIENKEIFFVYQPQYVIATGRICGMEALARWKTKEGDFIPPSDFIPLAEDLGLIIQLTENLLEDGFANLSRWHTEKKPIGLAFNLSARHLHHDGFDEYVENLINQFPIDPTLLEFELTETILMQDIDVACRIFGKLAERGIELSLDDFGTGYSSLKYLAQLPINKLKIDMSFVSKIGLSKENDSIINSIISLAKSLDLKTVAEGVETEAQLSFLREAGVDQVQGYLLSKPLPLDELEKLLANL